MKEEADKKNIVLVYFQGYGSKSKLLDYFFLINKKIVW